MIQLYTVVAGVVMLAVTSAYAVPVYTQEEDHPISIGDIPPDLTPADLPPPGPAFPEGTDPDGAGPLPDPGLLDAEPPIDLVK